MECAAAAAESMLHVAHEHALHYAGKTETIICERARNKGKKILGSEERAWNRINGSDKYG